MRSAQKPVLGRIVSRMFSLSIYTPIQADLFGLNLQKPLQSVWAFSDWDDLGGNFSDHDLAAADNLMPETARTYMRNLRAAGKQTRGWHFAEDPTTRYLTVCLPKWTNDWTRLLLGLNVLRQILPTSGDGQPGYILAHQFDGPQSETLGAVLMRHGASQVVSPHSTVIPELIAHARPLASRVLSMSKMPTSHVVDQLETISDERRA